MTVHAPDCTYAAQQAPSVLRQAERAADALDKLLKPSEQGQRECIDIYLADPPAYLEEEAEVQGYLAGSEAASAQAFQVFQVFRLSSSTTPSTNAIVRMISPEAPGEPISLPVTRLLAARWFGPNAGSAQVFVDGIAGVIGGRLGLSSTVQQANERAKAQIAAHRSLSVLSRPQPSPSTSTGLTDAQVFEDFAATSFVSFLIDSYGTDTLRQFLATYDPSRRDHAAIGTYHRPLGALEELWLAGLRRPAGRTAAFRSFLRYLGPLVKPYWRREVEVFVYMLLGLTYGVVMPLSSKYLVDTVIPSGSASQLAIFIGVLLLIYWFNSLVGMRRAYVNTDVNQHVIINLQEKLLTRLQQLSHNFYAEAKTGDLMSRMTNDLQLVQQALGQVAGSGLYMALSAVAAAITLLVLSPLLGVVLLFIVPLFAVSYLVLGARLQQASRLRQKLAGEATASIQENLSAHSVVKAFGLEKSTVAQYHTRLMSLYKAGTRLTVIAVLFEISMNLATTLGQLIVLGVGGYLVMQGQITVGTLLAFIGLLPSLFQPIAALSSVGQTVQMASGALDRITELLDEPVDIEDRPDATALPPLSREITLEKVAFSYGGDRTILHDLDLTIPAGSNMAIVGPSGSGKSTVVSLLLRFWDPEQGSVRFDGHDIRNVELSSLRDQVAIVFQDTFIFDTTVRENIAIGKLGAMDHEIVAAARAARLDSYIEALPNGYDTVLGERGVRMSGGQRQRLAIARALLRDPRILILDEATSALDAHTEREILETLASLPGERTTISITHRLAMAAMTNHIFVLEQGRVVEQGPHEQLVQGGGLYQQLYEEQMSGVGGVFRRVGIDESRLRAIPLFASLDTEALSSLAERLLPERYGAGVDVVRQGDEGDRLYIITDGQVEVLVDDGAGEQRRVNMLSTGDYFGEMALLMGEPRTASVRTNLPTNLLSLSRIDFMQLIEREAPLRTAISGTVATRRMALESATAAVTGVVLAAPATSQ